MTKQKTIIVIGAGIAGVAAAEKLSRKYKVILLEAQSDVGGRAKNKNGIPLGPMHVHEIGEYEGSAADYVQSHSDFLLNADDIPSIQPVPALLEKYHIPFSSGQDKTYVVGTKASDFNLEKFNMIFQQYDIDSPTTTIEEIFAKKLILIYEEAYSGINYQELSSVMQHAKERGIDFIKYGDSHPLVRGDGYYGLIKSMVSDMDNVELHLNCVVSSIELKQDKVLVTTKSGDTFEADAVIPTLPLGVLQKEVVSIKELSFSKKAAIQHFKMGMMNKIIVKYAKQFWDNSFTFYRIFNTTPDNESITLFMNGNNIFSDIEPTLLSAFFADQAIQDKDILTKIVLNAIKEAWPEAPTPLSVEVTAWHLDPYCYGSYANVSDKSFRTDIANLMQPEWSGRFVLAGDGIVPAGLQGTIHGAYISGLRAARLIDNCLSE